MTELHIHVGIDSHTNAHSIGEQVDAAIRAYRGRGAPGSSRATARAGHYQLDVTQYARGPGDLIYIHNSLDSEKAEQIARLMLDPTKPIIDPGRAHDLGRRLRALAATTNSSSLADICGAFEDVIGNA